jgi:hypothetical protein
MGGLDPDWFGGRLLAAAENNPGDESEGDELVGNRDQILDHFYSPEGTNSMAEWEIVLALVGDLIGALAIKGVVDRDDIGKIMQGSITAADLDGRSDLLDELACIRHVTINACSTASNC